MSDQCEHPEEHIKFTGSSVEAEGIGSRFPKRVWWYQCNLCGADWYETTPPVEEP